MLINAAKENITRNAMNNQMEVARFLFGRLSETLRGRDLTSQEQKREDRRNEEQFKKKMEQRIHNLDRVLSKTETTHNRASLIVKALGGATSEEIDNDMKSEMSMPTQQRQERETLFRETYQSLKKPTAKITPISSPANTEQSKAFSEDTQKDSTKNLLHVRDFQKSTQKKVSKSIGDRRSTPDDELISDFTIDDSDSKSKIKLDERKEKDELMRRMETKKFSFGQKYKKSKRYWKWKRRQQYPGGSGMTQLSEVAEEDEPLGFKDDEFFETNLVESNSLGDEYFVRFRQLKKYNYCVILPDDPWKQKWDIFITFVLIFTVISTPYRIAFYDSDGYEWTFIQYAVDISFLIDMIFNFRTAFFNSQDQLIDRRRHMACNYLKGWFVVDFIAIFPLNEILRSSGTNINQLARLARLPRLYKILQFSRICKICRKPNSKNKFLKQLNALLKVSAACERLLVFLVIFVIMCHIVSCMWYFVAKVEDSPLSWTANFPEIETDSEYYLIGIYFTITTITTVGYGDISAHTTGQRMLCCILMLIGVVSYSYAIGSLSSLMTTLDAKTAKLKQKLQILENIRKDFKLNFILYRKMKMAIHFDHRKDLTDKYALIEQLPLRLQIELSIVVHQQLVQDIQFFKSKPAHFIAMVAPLLKPLSLSRGEYIFHRGDPLDALYFLKKGTIGLVQRKFPADLVFIRIEEGSYFGQYDFLVSGTSESKRTFTTKALTDVELLLLDKKDLYKVDMEYKDITEQLFANAFSRLTKAENSQLRAQRWYVSTQQKQKTKPQGLVANPSSTPLAGNLHSILSEDTIMEPSSQLTASLKIKKGLSGRFEPLAALIKELCPTDGHARAEDDQIINQELRMNSVDTEQLMKDRMISLEISPRSITGIPRPRYFSQFVSKESFQEKNRIIQDRAYQLNPHTGRLENSMLQMLQTITQRLDVIQQKLQTPRRPPHSGLEQRPPAREGGEEREGGKEVVDQEELESERKPQVWGW